MSGDNSEVIQSLVGGHPAASASVADKGAADVQSQRLLDLQSVIDGMSEGFALLDSNFTILDINAETLRLETRSRDQIVGRSHWDVYPGSEDSALGALYKKAMHERVPVSLEHRHVWEDGSASWLDMRAFPIEQDRLAIFFRDVTDRYEAEERFRDLADNINAVFYVHELDELRISYVSPAYEDIWERTAAELYTDALAFIRAIHPDDRATVQAAVARQMNGENTESRYRLVRSDGSIRYIHDRAFVTRKTQSKRRVVGIAEDVTVSTEARLQLARNAETFRALVRDSPFGVYVVDSDFRLAYTSQGCDRAFAGIDPLLGRDFNEILRTIWPEAFASEIAAHFRKTLMTGHSYTSHRTIEQRGNVAAVEAYDWRIDRIVLPDGSFGVVCYFYDLTEQITLENSLRQALDDKDMLAREIDHRVRNSLSLVSSLLGMQKRAARSTDVKEALLVAAARIKAVARIHEQLYTGRQVGVVQFDDYLAQICGDLNSSLAREGARIELRTVPVEVAVDQAVSLGLVVNELVTNAFKHGHVDDVVIDVTLAAERDGLALTVADNGTGMPADFVSGTGTGLGMKVVAMLVQQLGAKISLPGAGEAAHFKICIPSQ